jgi:hypothetical protein
MKKTDPSMKVTLPTEAVIFSSTFTATFSQAGFTWINSPSSEQEINHNYTGQQ